MSDSESVTDEDLAEAMKNSKEEQKQNTDIQPKEQSQSNKQNNNVDQIIDNKPSVFDGNKLDPVNQKDTSNLKNQQHNNRRRQQDRRAVYAEHSRKRYGGGVQTNRAAYISRL